MSLDQNRNRASLANWRQAPHNKWAFQNIRQLITTDNIRASREAKPFVDAHTDIFESKNFDCVDGKNLDTILRESFTDSLVVLRRDNRIWQWQATHCDIEKPHIIFSVSKSITAMLAGILVDQGVLDTDKSLLHYLPGVKGSAYEDCSLQQLLDMQVALVFDESYLDMTGDFRRYRDATGWNPADQNNPGPNLETFLYGLKKSEANHGEVFCYNSPNSDLLGLLIERTAGASYAELLSSLIWQPLGAQSDGYVTVDRSFLARGAGGICVTVNDLAAVGQLMLNRGAAAGRQMISEQWINDTTTAGSYGAWQKGDFVEFLPEGRYRNQWYQPGDADGSFMALGIHGQWLYINPAVEIIIAKMASQPEPLDDRLDRQTLAVFAEICDSFK